MPSWIHRLVLLALIGLCEGLAYYGLHEAKDYRILSARWGIGFAAFFLILGFSRLRSALQLAAGRWPLQAISIRWLAAHTAAFLFFLALSSPGTLDTYLGPDGLGPAILWAFTGALSAIFAALALLPFPVWKFLFQSTGKLPVFTAISAALATAATPLLWSLWSHWTFGIDLTFWLVRQELRPFLSTVVLDPSARLIGSPRFAALIGDSCSGWEGISLIAVFTSVFLWFSRSDYKFPRALLLLPAAIATVFALNSLRIAALVLIGHFVSPEVAVRGFHSQAGWIGFTLVAVAVSLIAPRIHSLRTNIPARIDPAPSYPAVPYLLPFVTIIAVGMLSLAASDGFERLYPLRFVAAIAVLWYFRNVYRQGPWTFSWFPFIGGAIVFVLWISLEPSHPPTHNDLAAGLAKLSPTARFTWISFRALAAATTVPLAEELAFRGFLFRRLISSDFEHVDFRRFTYLALIVSSLLFGALHGDRWVAGSLAGLLYAACAIRRGKLWDAVLAHAITNTLLAAWIIIGGKWFYW